MSEEILQGSAGMWVYETVGWGEGGPEHDIQQDQKILFVKQTLAFKKSILHLKGNIFASHFY